MAIVETMPVGPLMCNMVLIADPDSLDALLIDPGGDPENIIAIIENRGFHVRKILITHAHFDHILAVPDLVNYTKAEVYYNPGDRNL